MRLNCIRQPKFHLEKREQTFFDTFYSRCVDILQLAAFHLDPREPFAKFLKDTLELCTPPKSSLELKFYNAIVKKIIQDFIDDKNIDDDENIEDNNIVHPNLVQTIIQNFIDKENIDDNENIEDNDIVLKHFANFDSLFRWEELSGRDELYWKTLYYYFI